MVLTDAELLELEAEMDYLEEAMAKNEKHHKDLEIKAVNNLIKIYGGSFKKSETKIHNDLAEIRSMKAARKLNEEHVKDLIKRIRKAIAEEDASSSK